MNTWLRRLLHLFGITSWLQKRPGARPSPAWPSRTALEALAGPERQLALRQLEADLDACLAAGRGDWQRFWEIEDQLIQALKAQGHDLWSHDYDGYSKHLWGWDYMRLESAGELQIQFDFKGPTRVFWRGEDGRLGVT